MIQATTILTRADSKMVPKWFEKHTLKIEVFYLPPYNAQLNPLKYLSADMKQAVTTNVPGRAKGQLKMVTISPMREVSTSPERVPNYFQYHPARYAA